jgi:hypothetical protein
MNDHLPRLVKGYPDGALHRSSLRYSVRVDQNCVGDIIVTLDETAFPFRSRVDDGFFGLEEGRFAIGSFGSSFDRQFY